MARIVEASLCFVMFVVSVQSAPVAECADIELMVAGMGYGCNALLNQTISDKKHLGVYDKRISICNENNYGGCCKTCKQVLKNECKDGTLDIADGGYDCKALVDKTYSAKKDLGAYEKNTQLCNDVNYSGCCETCQRVLNEANITSSTEQGDSTDNGDQVSTSSTEQGDSTDNGDQVNSGESSGPVNNAVDDIKTPQIPAAEQDLPNIDSGSLYTPNQEQEPQVGVASGKRGFKYNIEVHEVEKDGRNSVRQ